MWRHWGPGHNDRMVVEKIELLFEGRRKIKGMVLNGVVVVEKVVVVVVIVSVIGVVIVLGQKPRIRYIKNTIGTIIPLHRHGQISIGKSIKMKKLN